MYIMRMNTMSDRMLDKSPKHLSKVLTWKHYSEDIPNNYFTYFIASKLCEKNY